MYKVSDRRISMSWPVAFAAGYTNQGSFVTAIERSGDYAVLDGVFKLETGNFVPGTTYTDIFVVPPKLRPKQTVYGAVLAGPNAGSTGTIIIYADGKVEYRHQQGNTSYMSFGSTSWPCKPIA